MLCLSRKPHQVLIFELPDGRCIIVDYYERKGNKIRLRMDAPPDVKIRRGEVKPEPTKEGGK